MVFTKRCAKAGIEMSTGSVGDCYDNAVCETFHASIKKERIYRCSWPTRAEARAAVFEYIDSPRYPGSKSAVPQADGQRAASGNANRPVELAGRSDADLGTQNLTQRRR